MGKFLQFILMIGVSWMIGMCIFLIYLLLPIMQKLVLGK